MISHRPQQTEDVGQMIEKCGNQIQYKFEFTTNNVPGPGFPSDPDELAFAGCDCGQPSCGELCPCILRFGVNYTEFGKLLKLEDELSSATKPIVECNAMCECGESCQNRVVQNGPPFKLEVFTTDRKGSGLQTLEAIPHSSFVCEYAGELLTKTEAQRRLKLLGDGDLNYILVVREFASAHRLTETIIDPTFKGNLGRFINHSCEPNLLKVPVRVHNDIPRVALFARRDIESGEELTYSYGEPDTSSGVIDSSADKQKSCYCGSRLCCGYLPSDQSLLK